MTLEDLISQQFNNELGGFRGPEQSARRRRRVVEQSAGDHFTQSSVTAKAFDTLALLPKT